MYDYITNLADYFTFLFGGVDFFNNTIFDVFGNIFLTLGLCLLLLFPLLVLRKIFFVLVGD